MLGGHRVDLTARRTTGLFASELASHPQALPATGMPVADYVASNGLIARDDLGGLNLSDVPAVFVEVGNMRNDTDVALLLDPEFRQATAVAIRAALEEFLG